MTPADTDSAAANAALVTDAPAATAAAADPALEKAIANGYREQPEPSRDQRIIILIADVEHAMASNGPMTPAMLIEMKALLA